MPAGSVLVIGAGPYGLSVSAHLRHLGVEHTIVGRPMDTWRSHMPAGMYLKSDPYGSVISAARPGYDLATWARVHGVSDYHERIGPLSLERFLAYSDWFTGELVPEVRDDTVTHLTSVDRGFRVEFAGGSTVTARQVVVATGILPFAHVPAELAGLPAGLVTHSSAHHRLEKFRGQRLAVIGAGQAAIETATLAAEAGAIVQLVARAPELSWSEPIPPELGLFARIKHPPRKLCEGWSCVFYDTPELFKLLPKQMQVRKAHTVLGPQGSWWLRSRFEAEVETLAGYSVTAATPHGSGVRLQLDGPDRRSIDVDHVIAGTGFQIDVTRLPFLADGVQASLATRAHFPVVNRAGESTVPGLYFAGAPAMVSLGPSMRFVAGTFNIAGPLARAVARRAAARGTHRPMPASRVTAPESRDGSPVAEPGRAGSTAAPRKSGAVTGPGPKL